MADNQLFGPNEKLSNRDREALARDNERQTRQALEMADRQTQADRESGRNINPIQEAAGVIQGKIERGEMRPNDRQ